MKTLTTLFALATLCATAYGQTIKALGYNTTNGQVVYSGTNILRMPSEVRFGTNSAGLNSGGQFLNLINGDGGVSILLGSNAITVNNRIAFGGTSSNALASAAATRTNLGLPLPALTNTSNADMLSALGAVQTIFKLKTSTTLYDTNELVADPDLFFVAEANKNYAVTLFIFSPTDPASSNFAAQITQTGDADIIGAWTKSAAADAFQPTGALVTERSEIFFPDDIPSGWAQHFTVIGGNSNSTITLNIAADDEARIGAGSYLKAEVIQ
jgi:hypothetical protein